jgi:hypothetical protein
MLAAALACAGCGPSIAELLREHRTRDAFCAISTEHDASQVVPVVLADIAPTWRVREIVREDLPGLDDAFATEVFGSFVLVVVELGLRAPPGLRVVAVSFFDGRVTSPPLGPGGFAALTGETRPGPREESELKFSIPWALVTLGASILFEGHHETVTRYPTDAEIRQAAPRSAKLYDAIARKFGSRELVALRRGAGEHVARVGAHVFIDDVAGGCRNWQTQVDLEGPPVSLSAHVPWPAGDAFQAFARGHMTYRVEGNQTTATPVRE